MKREWWMGRWGKAIAALMGLGVLGFAFAQQDAMPRREVTLLAQGVRLSATDPAIENVGALKFMGGLWLRSEDKGFGGLSGLVVSENQGGLRLIGVTDQGEKLTARLVLEGGRLIGLDQSVLQPLVDEQGAPIAGKSLGDGESVTRMPDGRILVGFERRHRIWAYGPDLTGPAAVFVTPEALGGAPSNGGLESIAGFPDGRLLAITERLDSGDGNIAAFLWNGRAWSSLSWKPSAAGFAPVDATVAPNGDLLVLERYFTAVPPGGLSSRILRVPGEAVRGGALLQGELLAELTSPLISENFEGIAAIRSAGGAIQIGIASDNNFSSLQRTLLLWFEMPGGA